MLAQLLNYVYLDICRMPRHRVACNEIAGKNVYKTPILKRGVKICGNKDVHPNSVGIGRALIVYD